MSAFIDAGVFVAAYNTKDRRHEEAIKLIEGALRRRWGAAYTSDYIFDEAVTLMLARTKKPDFALGMGEFILGNPSRNVPGSAGLLRVDDEVFADSWALFKRYAGKGLSFTDCSTVALMKRAGVDVLLSFDRSFDGIVKRAESS